MQVILGSGGTIGNFLAKELGNYNTQIRLASRNPKKVNSSDKLQKTDLTNATEVFNSVKGCEVAYLTAGLKYSTPFWQEYWPKIMQNAIMACAENNCKLVFFDNVYMYGKVEGVMTEECSFNPCSKKGKVRAEIAEMLLTAIDKGHVKALIARSADFYGPNTPLGVFNMLALDKLKAGKKAQWLLNADKLHSFTYTPDAARCTAILGNDDKAYNQTWHVATHKETFTGRQLIELAEDILGVAHKKPQVLGNFMMTLGGLFSPEIKESKEMLYQNEVDYVFSSAKFEKAYNFLTTDYQTGIRITLGSV